MLPLLAKKIGIDPALMAGSLDTIDHGHDIGGTYVYGSVDIEHLTLEISDEVK